MISLHTNFLEGVQQIGVSKGITNCFDRGNYSQSSCTMSFYRHVIAFATSLHFYTVFSNCQVVFNHTDIYIFVILLKIITTSRSDSLDFSP